MKSSIGHAHPAFETQPAIPVRELSKKPRRPADTVAARNLVQGPPLEDLVVLRPLDVMRLLRISRFKFYRLVKEGHIRTHKMGRSTIIKRAEFQAFLCALPEREIACAVPRYDKLVEP